MRYLRDSETTGRPRDEISYSAKLKFRVCKRKEWIKENPEKAEFLRKKRVREYFEKIREKKHKVSKSIAKQNKCSIIKQWK